MYRPIYKDKVKQIIKIEIEGLGFIPICKDHAKQLIVDQKMICKQKTCLKKAIGFLRTYKGYKAICEECFDKNDYAVTTLLRTEKYGFVFICNKYKNYINSFTPVQRRFMGLEGMYSYCYTYFYQNHKNPERQHYYQDYKNYHIPAEYRHFFIKFDF